MRACLIQASVALQIQISVVFVVLMLLLVMMVIDGCFHVENKTESRVYS